MSKYLIEACIDSVSGGLAAQTGGASRVELCADLFNGGTTPGPGAIQLAVEHLAIPVHVMIRPRGGDFVYSPLELDEMAHDIVYAKETSAAGIVLGLLRPNATIARDEIHNLIDLARPLSVTFHRAFDMVADPFAALDQLIELGVGRVLTSGMEATAFEGAELIAELIRHAAGRIIVMPGGGINERNITRIARITGATEFHLSARSSVESTMQVRNPHVRMGGALYPPEYARLTTSSARLSACAAALHEVAAST